MHQVGAGNVSEKSASFSNAGAFMRSQIAQGRSAGMAVPTLLRGSQNMILTVLALSILSLWAIYRYRYGEAELMRYLGTGTALAGCLVFSGSVWISAERGNSAERLDRLSGK